MARVRVREQEGHGDRVDLLREQLADRVLDAGRIQRADDLAAEVQALVDLEHAVAREQHLRGGGVQVEHIGAAPLAADLVDVAKATRGQQAHAHALALQHGVQRRRGSVQDQRDGAGTELVPEVARDLVHDLHRLRRVGRVLADGDDLAHVLVEGRDVGEGAADVDADAQPHAVASAPARSAAVAGASTSSVRGSRTTPYCVRADSSDT